MLEKLKTLFTNFPGVEADKVLPTVGLNIGRFEAYGSPLVFWDLGGQAGLRSIWDKYYGESHALMFVVDASDKHRIEEAKACMDKALGNRELYGAPLLVLANKQDVAGSVAACDVAEQLEIGSIEARPCNVQSVSAISGDGLKAAVQWLVERVRKSQRAELLRHKVLMT
ncbi:hypothetical protein N2152v2_009779 [Parachlorella kessleri]